MRWLLRNGPLLLLLLETSGCAMCCAPYDCDYPYVGGRWVRHNPSSGRVGSEFDEAGGPVEALSTAGAAAPPQSQTLPRNLGENYLPTMP
jgi:hypothetical protein